MPLAAVLTLSACGEPALDTSSEEAMSESVHAILAGLPEDAQEEFKDAMQTVLVLGMLSRTMAGKTADEARAELFGQIDGKSAAEVIELAREMKR